MNTLYKIKIPVVSLLLLAAIVLSLKLGQLQISYAQILQVMTGNESNTLISDIILHLRLPRILFAALVGGGLAMCGYVMQTAIQNPLADPYILGISSGASLGASLGISLHFATSGPGQQLLVPLLAFTGALGAIAFVYFAANYKGRSSTTRLILAGVIVNSICIAVTNLLIYYAKNIEGARSITFWTMGSLANVSWNQVIGVMVAIGVSVIYFLTQYRALNLMSLGDEPALSLGLDVNKKRKVYIAIVTLLTGVMVAQCGIIGFIGLVVPHAVRALCRTSGSVILPVVLLGGGLFMVLVDTLSRVLLTNQEIPIGIITSLIGAPVFFLIFLKRGYGS
ncbi:FecCD family ABC transporter permease [Chitinophaga nivalis]|uniref:Iron ABC transporter permease n=1 Tax=Chitinophaga nivalis TaxID=2991709 RepID=A0ABT3INI5_9BACT|nr:iron ABC transporter permease [Chitinophaga nivalis]MCW3464789.1 iron ABC transporter permease [Chitinophaga nivalis]MCW3485520.1 iron ABC transporter permease [Chitinophaga nivalis]